MMTLFTAALNNSAGVFEENILKFLSYDILFLLGPVLP